MWPRVREFLQRDNDALLCGFNNYRHPTLDAMNPA